MTGENGEGERVATALARDFSGWLEVAPQPAPSVRQPRPTVRIRHKATVRTVSEELKPRTVYEALRVIPEGADVVIEVRGDVDYLCESWTWIGPCLRHAATVEVHAQGRAVGRFRQELQNAIDSDEPW